MISGIDVRIRVRGLPEGVQRLADVLDFAFPDCFYWQALPTQEADQEIHVVGSIPASIRLKKQDSLRRVYKIHLRSIETAPVTLNRRLLSSAPDRKRHFGVIT